MKIKRGEIPDPLLDISQYVLMSMKYSRELYTIMSVRLIDDRQHLQSLLQADMRTSVSATDLEMPGVRK